MALDIGSRIIELRSARGLSQEALANELGLSRQAVSRWERGEALPDTENLIALADLFGVTLDELVRPQVAPADNTTEAPEAEEAPKTPADPEAPTPEETPDPTAEAEPPADVTTDPGTTVPETEPIPTPQPAPEPATQPIPTAYGYVPPAPGPTPPPVSQPPSTARRVGIALIVAGLVLILVGGLIRLAGMVLFNFVPSSRYDVSSETSVAHSDDVLYEDQIDITGQGIKSIELSWPSGDVQVVPVDDSETDGNIRLEQNRFTSANDALRWSIEGDTLKIFADPGISNIGETIITLMIPASVIERLDSLSVEVLAGSADVQVNASDLDVTIGSGFAHVSGEISDFDLEVASGEAHVEGIFANASIEVGSGSAEVTVLDASSLTELSLELASGDLMVALPESAEFTLVEESTGPGQIQVSDFAIVYNGRAGVVGSGAIAIEAEVASGTIQILPFPE